MDWLLIITTFAAIVSVGMRAIGPRPTGWNDIPEIDVNTFQASFGIEPE